MHPMTIELMRDQARAIYRALTGTDMPEPEAPTSTNGQEASSELPAEEVVRRFADLDAMARAVPSVNERVPPFSFVPPLDVFEDDKELLLDLALPGVDREDLSVERTGDALVISGVRRGRQTKQAHYDCAEIPRGPFHRVVPLPASVEGEPRVEVDRGIVQIHLSKTKQ